MNDRIHVSAEPAAALAASLVSALARLNSAAIAVSGGSTPRKLFRILANDFRHAAAWNQVRIFQVDERCVPPDHDDSNWKMLNETLLYPIPEIRAFRMEAERPQGAEDYEACIRNEVAADNEGMPVFDLILLGMGSDGHTASLFPGTHALGETTQLVVRNPVPQLKTERVTMTFPLIRAAAKRWFLVSGPDKAPAYVEAKAGKVPAGQVGPSEWFVDPPVVA